MRGWQEKMKEEIMQIQLQSSTSHMLVKHTARTNDQRAKLKMEESQLICSQLLSVNSGAHQHDCGNEGNGCQDPAAQLHRPMVSLRVLSHSI